MIMKYIEMNIRIIEGDIRREYIGFSIRWESGLNPQYLKVKIQKRSYENVSDGGIPFVKIVGFLITPYDKSQLGNLS